MNQQAHSSYSITLCQHALLLDPNEIFLTMFAHAQRNELYDGVESAWSTPLRRLATYTELEGILHLSHLVYRVTTCLEADNLPAQSTCVPAHFSRTQRQVLTRNMRTDTPPKHE